jgi:biotin carboxyl carrier protein
MVNGELLSWDIVKISEDYFYILYKNKSYRAELVQVDKPSKSFVFKINNHVYTVIVKDKFDLLLAQMGISNASSTTINNIKAPMPGLIIELKVSEGDEVKTGDTLLILEAMKMENIIKSPRDGKVKSVKIKKGDSVEKAQILIEFW